MIQHRTKAGLFNANKPLKIRQKNKWSLLSFTFNNLLNELFIIFIIFSCLGASIPSCKPSRKFLNAVLFITNVFYYYKCSKYLFICQDVEKNPGDSQGLLKFSSWNLNSIKVDNFIRVSALQAYSSLKDLHIIALTE